MGTKRKLDFYFSFISLYTYIGHEAFEALVKKYDLEVTYKPIDLHAIFSVSVNCCQFRSTTKESISIVNHCSNMG